MNSQNDPGLSRDVRAFRELCILLDSAVGVPARVLEIPTGADPPFWIIAYDHVPTTGSTTAFTFGISCVKNAAWRLGSPELVINVDSKDNDWFLSLATLCVSLRGTCPFSLGNVLRHGKPLSSESSMSAYLLFVPTILDNTQSRFSLSDRKLNFIQAYPIFDIEANIIATDGVEAFFRTEGLEFSDIHRDQIPFPHGSPK